MKNIVRKIFHLFIVAIFLVYLPLHCDTTGQAGTPPVGSMLPNGPMPKLTEDDMNAMMQMLESMDDETLDALAKIGEEFIKEAEERGEDPFELLGFPTESDQEEQQTPEVEPQPIIEIPAQQPQTELPKLNGAQMQEIKTTLTAIAKHIASIRQKSQVERRAAEKLKPLQYLLDDITYFVHTLKQDKLLKYLSDKAFRKLYNALVDLEHELQYLEPLFVLRESSLEETSPYTILGVSRKATWPEINNAYQKLLTEKNPQKIKRQLKKDDVSDKDLEIAFKKADQEYESITEAYSKILSDVQSHQALDQIIDAFIRATSTHKIIENSKKLLERYEPEALRIKEEQEKLEAQARKKQEKAIKQLPPFSMPIFEPSPYYGGYEMLGEPTGDNYLTTTPTESGYAPTDTHYQPSQSGAIRPGHPGAEQAKSDKKTPSDKKKKSSVKGKKFKRKIPKNKKVEKKLELFEKELDTLKEYIDKGTLETGDIPAKNLLDNLNQFIIKPIAISKLQFEETIKDLQKMASIKSALNAMTRTINQARKKLEATGLSKEERIELKEEARALFEQEEYQEKINQIKYAELAKINPDFNKSNPIKSYVILGGTKIDPNKYKETLEKYGLINNVTLSKGKPTNFLKAFTDTYSKFKEELKETDTSKK